MAATVDTVLAAMAAQIVTAIPTLRAVANDPDVYSPPVAICRYNRGIAHTSFSGRGTFMIDVVLFVAVGTRRAGVKQRNPWMALAGSGSIVGALESDITLGGTAEGLMIEDWQDIGEEKVGDIDVFSARLPVECWVTY